MKLSGIGDKTHPSLLWLTEGAKMHFIYCKTKNMLGKSGDIKMSGDITKIISVRNMKGRIIKNKQEKESSTKSRSRNSFEGEHEDTKQRQTLTGQCITYTLISMMQCVQSWRLFHASVHFVTKHQKTPSHSLHGWVTADPGGPVLSVINSSLFPVLFKRTA